MVADAAHDQMRKHLQAQGTALPYLSRIFQEELWDDWGFEAQQLLVLGAANQSVCLMQDTVMSLLHPGLHLPAAC